MNVWLDSLESLLEKNYLNKYDEIYYLGSTKLIGETWIENSISEGNLKDLILKNEASVHEDSLDFFLFVNDEFQDLIVIYSPFDLFENDRIYFSQGKIDEDLSTLPEIDVVK